MSRSLSTDELAERWQRRPEWVTQTARQGGIPGAWKLGHLWRFAVHEIEAYEISKQSQSIFALTDNSRRRQKKICLTRCISREAPGTPRTGTPPALSGHHSPQPHLTAVFHYGK